MEISILLKYYNTAHPKSILLMCKDISKISKLSNAAEYQYKYNQSQVLKQEYILLQTL